MTKVQRRNFVKCLIANVGHFLRFGAPDDQYPSPDDQGPSRNRLILGYCWFKDRPMTSRLGNCRGQNPSAWTLVTREHRIWTLVTGHGCGGWTLVITPRDRPPPPFVKPGLLQNSQRLLARSRTAVRTCKPNRFSRLGKIPCHLPQWSLANGPKDQLVTSPYDIAAYIYPLVS